MVGPKGKPDGTPLAVTLKGGEHDFVGLGCVFKIAVGFNTVLQTLHKMIDFSLKRMMRHIAGIRPDGGDFHPVGLPRKLVGPDVMVKDASAIAEDTNGKPIRHDALGVDRDLPNHAIGEFHENHLKAIVLHGGRILDPGIGQWVILPRLSFAASPANGKNLFRFCRFEFASGCKPPQGIDGMAPTDQQGTHAVFQGSGIVPSRPPAPVVTQIVGFDIVWLAKGIIRQQ